MKVSKINFVIGASFILALFSFVYLYSQGLTTNCQNPVSFYLYCNKIPDYELQAMQFLNQTIGSNSLPYNSNNTVLSWWDYGDWINFFGHSGSVLRGDNQLPQLDYEVAYMFVNANQTQLADFMKKVGASYLMFEVGLLPKWSALNYLSCIYQNKTSFSNPIGTSSCEQANMPIYLIIPAQLNNLNFYCANLSTSSNLYIKAISNLGQEYCLQTIQTSQGNQIDGKIYDLNGTLLPYLNLVPVGEQTIQNTNYNVYLLLYVPNRTTCTYPADIQVPQFYKSNYYLMYEQGCWNSSLFTQVYPSNNAIGQVRIWKLNQGVV